MNNQLLRDKILVWLYNFNEKHHYQYVLKTDLAQEFELTEDKLSDEVLVLAHQGYVDITSHSAIRFECVRITPAGRLQAEQLMK